MRSPFPGMDPFLESADIWPDFHDHLAGQIARNLNRSLPRPYYARLDMRPEVGIIGKPSTGRIVPDVAMVHPTHSPPSIPAGSAVIDRPRSEPCIPVPLRQGDSEIPLDLQYTFEQIYADGPYARGAIDYQVPPDPPVPPHLESWLGKCLECWQVG